ncbi:MAG: protoporphyrinogen oxidase [bacterium]
MSSKTQKKIVIVGAGISGLATAYYLLRSAEEKNIKIELQIYEAESRVGGKIVTEKMHGFICEGGPNGFLDNKPWCLDLSKEIGLEKELYMSDEAAAKRYIYSGGILHKVPESPGAFFRSPLLSVWGRLRVALEPLMPRCPQGTDETIASFGRRRIGREAVEKLLDPMVSGVFAGDPEALSLSACFPRIAELEREYGSLVRAMLALRRKAKKETDASKKSSGPAGPAGRLISFRDGVETLIIRLLNIVGDERVHTSTRIDNIERGTDGFTLNFENGNGHTPVTADVVVLAVPAFYARTILRNCDENIAEELGGIPYAPMAVVCTGFSRASVSRAMDGFGFLVPHREKKQLLGSLWCSSIFPNRAAGNSVLMRNMAGGSRDIRTPFLEDEELTTLTVEELRPIMGITGKPSFVKIFRWRNAIPQYVVGHKARIERIEECLRTKHPGLFITGNAYHGIAMNDCVENAITTADKVIGYIHDS